VSVNGNSVCTTCRRENIKLFLKGDRCFTDKCSFERRAYPPGQHGQGRIKFSEYALQLREKQKVRKMYGVYEKQFENGVIRASQQSGVTGEVILSNLERRLDSVVYLMGYAESRNQARQLIVHKHFLVNGRKMDIPSYLVKMGDVVEVKEKSKKMKTVLASIEAVKRREIPKWIELEQAKFKGTVKQLPKRADITVPIQENLIVEYYSR
jgi:small subunit ribosomal protein S4